MQAVRNQGRRAVARGLLALAALTLVTATAPAQNATTRPFVDSAGRQVQIPTRVTRVLAAGPPASVLVYTLAPDKLAGWIRAPSAEERPFLPPQYAALPVHGRLTGRGDSANVEAVLAMRPDLIVDVGTIDATYASLADRVQQQTGIPYVLIDGSFANTAQTYRTLGTLIGEATRAEELASYAERTLSELRTRLDAIPPAQRPRVYYGRGPRGLETGLAGSINLEVLEQVGAVNVAAGLGRGGLTNVSLEQVLGWNPDVILTLDAAFYRSVGNDPLWQPIKAVRERRVYLAPAVPWGWIDAPPGVNRLIGIRWLTAMLYPDAFPEDLRAITRDFYARFYHVQLDDAQLDGLLRPATSLAR